MTIKFPVRMWMPGHSAEHMCEADGSYLLVSEAVELLNSIPEKDAEMSRMRQEADAQASAIARLKQRVEELEKEVRETAGGFMQAINDAFPGTFT